MTNRELCSYKMCFARVGREWWYSQSGELESLRMVLDRDDSWVDSRDTFKAKLPVPGL